MGLGAQVHAELPHYLGRLCWKKCRNQVNRQDDVRFGLRHCSPQIHSFLMAKETVNSSRGTGRGDQQRKGASHTSSAREQNIHGPSGKDEKINLIASAFHYSNRSMHFRIQFHRKTGLSLQGCWEGLSRSHARVPACITR